MRKRRPRMKDSSRADCGRKRRPALCSVKRERVIMSDAVLCRIRTHKVKAPPSNTHTHRTPADVCQNKKSSALISLYFKPITPSFALFISAGSFHSFLSVFISSEQPKHEHLSVDAVAMGTAVIAHGLSFSQ